MYRKHFALTAFPFDLKLAPEDIRIDSASPPKES